MFFAASDAIAAAATSRFDQPQGPGIRDASLALAAQNLPAADKHLDLLELAVQLGTP